MSVRRVLGAGLIIWGVGWNLAFELGLLPDRTMATTVHAHIAWATHVVMGGLLLISHQIDHRRER